MEPLKLVLHDKAHPGTAWTRVRDHVWGQFPGWCRTGVQAVALAGLTFCLTAAKTPPNRSYDLGLGWSRQPVTDWEANASYLSDRNSMPGSAAAWFYGLIDPNDLIDPRRARELRYQYQQMTQQRDQLENYHVGGRDAQGEYLSQVQDLRDKLRAAARDRERDKGLERVHEVAGKDGSKLPRSATVMVAVAALSTGQPVDAQVSDDVRLHAGAHLPQQVSYLQLYSPWINTDLSVSGQPPDDSIGKMFLQPPDWVPRTERYRLGVNRQLPLLDLKSGVGYGGTSHTVDANLSKALTPNLSARVSSVYALDPDSGAPAPVDQRVEMHYEVHF